MAKRDAVTDVVKQHPGMALAAISPGIVVFILLWWLTNPFLAIVLGVQQLEGNILQPFLQSRAMNLHPVVVLLSVAAGIVLLAAGRADWVTGTVDGVAGPVRTAAVGTEAAPGLAGIALVAMAAAIAATTSGRIARWICLGVLGLVAAGVVALSVRCVVAAPDVLGSVAATHSGGTGTLEATGSATAWPWVASGALKPPVDAVFPASRAGEITDGDRAAVHACLDALSGWLAG